MCHDVTQGAFGGSAIDFSAFFPPLGEGIPSFMVPRAVCGFLAVPELNSHSRAACHMVQDTDEKRGAEGVSAGKWVREIVGAPSAVINAPKNSLGGEENILEKVPPIRILLTEKSAGSYVRIWI